MTFDFLTSIYASLLMAGLCLATISVWWFQSGRRWKGSGAWVLFYTSRFLSLLLSLISYTQDGVFFTPLSVSLAFLGVFFFNRGFHEKSSKVISLHDIAFAIVFILGIAYFLFINHNREDRILFIGLMAIMIYFHTAFLIWFKLRDVITSHTRRTGLLVCLGGILLGIFSLTINISLHRGGMDFSPYYGLSVMLSSIFTTALLFSLVMINAVQLQGEPGTLFPGKDEKEGFPRRREEKSLILNLSAESSRVLGLSGEKRSLTGRDYLEFVLPDDKARISRELNLIREDEELLESEHRIINKEGKILWVLLCAINGGDKEKGRTLSGVLRDVTRKKVMEATLTGGERKYRSFFEKSPHAYFLYDGNGVFKEVNPALESLLGYKKEELSGKSFISLNLFLKNNFFNSLNLLIQNSLGRPTGPDSIRLRKKDGSIIHAELSTEPTKMGEEMLNLAFLRDMTTQNRLEKGLKQSEERFHDLLISSVNWIWEIDKDDRYTYSSPQVMDITGYTTEEVLGKTPFDLMPDALRDSARDRYRGFIRSRTKLVDQHNTLIRKDGKQIVIETNGTPIMDSNGEISGYRGINRDITEKFEKEEELKILRRGIEESPVSILITDREGIIQYANSHFLKNTGFSAQELQGKTPRVIKSDYHDKGYYETMWKELASGRVWQGEYKNSRKKGDKFWSYSTITPIVNRKGEITHYIGIQEDITEKKRLEASREDISRIMRHDLKTPLSTIIGFPQLLIMGENLTEEQKNYCRYIEESGHNMLEMINEYLEMAKLESGAYNIIPDQVNLGMLFDRIFLDTAELARDKEITIEKRANGRPQEDWSQINALGDRQLYYNAFINLTQNALEASPVKESVLIDLIQGDEFIEIILMNKGAVPVKIRDSFFDKYTTSGKTNGSGLGTYSAKLNLEIQDGTIRMETSEDEDTTVITATLKACRPDPAQMS